MLESKRFNEWFSEQLLLGRSDDRLDKEITELVGKYYSPDLEVSGKPLIGLDIDGTLTYSKSRMKLVSDGFNDPLYTTEILRGDPFCFMTVKAHRMLNVIRNNAYVVPVTSRGIEAFSRINLFTENTPYAVLNTGGRILAHGEFDTKWSQYIDDKTSYEIAPVEEVDHIFRSFSNQPWFSRMSTFRPDLVQIKLDPSTSIPSSVVNALRDTVEEMGWQLSKQGSKLFAIPSFLSKRIGFEEINTRVGADYTMTAGDSTLDIPLLEAGTYAFRPNHGELATHDYRAANLVVTDQAGILAGEEILARMLAVIGSSNC